MKSTEWSQVTQDPVTCPICGRTCAYQKELDRHLVEVWPQTKESDFSLFVVFQVHKREDVEHPSANRPQVENVKNVSRFSFYLERWQSSTFSGFFERFHGTTRRGAHLWQHGWHWFDLILIIILLTNSPGIWTMMRLPEVRCFKVPIRLISWTRWTFSPKIQFGHTLILCV